MSQGRLEVLQGSADSLPFSAGKFDRILTTHTVYFWPDPLAVFRELRRVIRPGGRLVLTYNEPDPTLAVKRFPAPIYTFRTQPELAALLTAAGWREITAHREPQRGRTMVWLTAQV